MPEFFRYPLKGHALYIIGFMVLVSGILQENIPTVILMLVGFTLQTFYGFTVLKNSAKGYLSPPVFSSMFDGNVLLLFKSLLWCIGLTILALSGFLIQPWVGLITLISVLFLGPASAILFVHESSVLAAINPIHLVGFVVRTGSGYVILFVHLALMTAASSAVDEVVTSLNFPQFLKQSVMGFFASYFFIMVYALSGYFLLQYQRQFGYVATILDDDSPQQEDVLMSVKFWVKRGNYRRAIRELESIKKHHPKNDTVKFYYWDLLMQVHAFDKLVPASDVVIKRMLTTKRVTQLIPFLEYLLKKQPNFIEDLSVRIELASDLIKNGHEKWAYKLLNNVHKLYPHDPKRTEALVLLGQVLGLLGQPDKAKKVASFALKKAPIEQQSFVEGGLKEFLS